MKNKFKVAFIFGWRPTIAWIIGIGVLAALLLFKLTSLLPGLSSEESLLQAMIAGNEISLKDSLVNSLYLPYNVLLWFMQTINVDSIVALRFISVVLGLVSIGSIYYLLTRWTTSRVAKYGIILFSTSSWFLHIARYGVAIDAMYSVSIIMLALAVWLQSTKRRRLLLLLMAGCLLSVYIPGFIWIIIGGVAWQRKRFWNELKRTSPWFKYIYLVLLITLLSPFMLSIIQKPSRLIAFSGLPSNVPSWSVLGENTLELAKIMFVDGIKDAAIWLPGTPMLSVFSMVMFGLGVYWCAYMWRLDRSRVLIGSIVFWSILIISGGPVRIAVLLPYVYLVIILGITLMLQQWFTVFPKNSVARVTALSFMTLAIGVTVLYNINHYFIAWPKTPETRIEYSLPSGSSDTIRSE